MAALSKLELGHLTIDDIVFKIGPRINAAGRMETGRLAVELLTASDDHTATMIGEKINDNNNDRKSIDREITQEALEMVQNGSALSTDAATIVYNPTWNKGVCRDCGLTSCRGVLQTDNCTDKVERIHHWIRPQCGWFRSLRGHRELR